MLTQMFVVFAGIVIAVSSLYFYIYRQRKPYYKYYLIGYQIVLAGIVISLIRLFFLRRSVALMILSLILYVLGFVVVLYGSKKKREGSDILKK